MTSRPSDLPPAEKWAHGVRARYISGCRCDLCRVANTQYENQRARARRRGDWNGLVPAHAARAHLLNLERGGVGTRSVKEACDVSRTVLSEVKLGRKKRIRARTSKKILEVTLEAIADAALVPAAPTWELIRQLIGEGFTKTRLARELGSKSKIPALQMQKDFVLAKTAAKVARLWRRYMT